jgi:hypothetical protein
MRELIVCNFMKKFMSEMGQGQAQFCTGGGYTQLSQLLAQHVDQYL